MCGSLPSGSCFSEVDTPMSTRLCVCEATAVGGTVKLLALKGGALNGSKYVGSKYG